MRKTDLIKFRCTPTDKARLQREAAYRQITLTELLEEALEPYLQGSSAAQSITAIQSPPPVSKQGCPNAGAPCNCSDRCQLPVGAPAPDPKWSQSTPKPPVVPVGSDATGVFARDTSTGELVRVGCPHGRPSARLCWECA